LRDVSSFRRKLSFATSHAPLAEFQITYDYDTHWEWLRFIGGAITQEQYLEKKRIQEYIYPFNFIKLRLLENHDMERAASLASGYRLLNWTAFSFFQHGATLVYAGQEVSATHRPSLFERETIEWNRDRAIEMSKFAEVHKNEMIAKGACEYHETKIQGVIEMSYKLGREVLYGIFNVEDRAGKFTVAARDGVYENLFGFGQVVVKNRIIELGKNPIAIRFKK
jgi:hypothetical protein